MEYPLKSGFSQHVSFFPSMFHLVPDFFNIFLAFFHLFPSIFGRCVQLFSRIWSTMTIDVVEHKGDAFKVRSTEELYQARDGGWVDLVEYMEVSQVIGVPLVIIHL